jgi:hypothetical protein
MSRNNTGMFMFVCTSVLYEYMNSLRNVVCNLFPTRIEISHGSHNLHNVLTLGNIIFVPFFPSLSLGITFLRK